MFMLELIKLRTNLAVFMSFMYFCSSENLFSILRCDICDKQLPLFLKYFKVTKCCKIEKVLPV